MESCGPSSLAEFTIHKQSVIALKKWLTDFKGGKKNKGGVFLIGTPGSGKTVLAKLLLEEYGFEVVEFQPDYNKTHKVEMARLKNIIQTQNVSMMFSSARKAVLFDDVEVGANNDRGFLADVIQLVEKQKHYSNPVIFTLNSNVKTKKLTTIEKYVPRIYLNRLSQYEMFCVGKQIVSRLQLDLPDFRLQFLANNCQGDLRCLYQGLEVHLKTAQKKATDFSSNHNESGEKVLELDQDESEAGEELLEIPETEAWGIYSKKELDVNPIHNIERLVIPTNQADYTQYRDIYDADTLFVPANIYENSWHLLQNTNFKQSSERDQCYQKVMESLADWTDFDPNFSDPSQLMPTEYAMTMSVYQPLHLIRKARKTRKFTNQRLKTSNMYSRISQSSFNHRSMKELSQQLQISPKEFYECSYSLMRILPVNLKLVASYFQKHGITRTNMERVFKYNCIYKQMEKTITSKQKSALKKLLKTS